ncbi:MAG: flavodoxin family protein [Desulfohalobiaceae bacterium]|nr:flavodoxin family protein [Desulfohalobiaceae bacterium]
MTILALYGSPRRNGNTARLLRQAVDGAREAGAAVEECILRDMTISPCLEIYGCKQDGRCVIKDDFQYIHDQLVSCQGVMLASPMFFYTVSSHTKILMDRCQSLWVKKYWIDQERPGSRPHTRKGLFIAAGATHGKKLFDGALLSVKYFFDTFDAELWKSLLCKGLDHADDVLAQPDSLQQAYASGRELAESLLQEPG